MKPLPEIDAPPIAPEADLRAFEFMPLSVSRLRDSAFASRVSGDEFMAGVLLWCASWHQLPPGSLPDDDAELAKFAGFGRVIKEWMKVKQGALHCFVRCKADGRLYHPVVCEKAAESWAERVAFQERKARDRARKAVNNPPPDTEGRSIPAEADGIPSETRWPSDGSDGPWSDHSGGIPAEIALKGQGQGKGQGYEHTDVCSATRDSVPWEIRESHVAWIVERSAGSETEPTAQVFLNRMSVEFGDDAVLSALDKIRAGPVVINPCEKLSATLITGKRNGRSRKA